MAKGTFESTNQNDRYKNTVFRSRGLLYIKVMWPAVKMGDLEMNGVNGNKDPEGGDHVEYTDDVEEEYAEGQ